MSNDRLLDSKEEMDIEYSSFLEEGPDELNSRYDDHLMGNEGDTSTNGTDYLRQLTEGQEDLDNLGKNTYEDSINKIFHFSYDNIKQEYQISEDELDKMCDLLNDNSGERDVHKDLDRLEAQTRATGDHDLSRISNGDQNSDPGSERKMSEMANIRELRKTDLGLQSKIVRDRGGTAALQEAEVTPTDVRNFLNDLKNLRLMAENREMQKIGKVRPKKTSIFGHDDYRAIPRTTTLQNFQENVKRRKKKMLQKLIPSIVVLIIITGISLFVFFFQMDTILRTILMFIVFGGIIFLVIVLIWKVCDKVKEREDQIFSRFGSLGTDSKIRGLIYRFNKARLKNRNAKAVISLDCDLLSVEINYDMGAQADITHSEINGLEL